MGKIPSRRVSSDDCVIHVGRKIEDDKIVEAGEEYRIHEGEWIEVVPVNSLRQFRALSELMAAGKDSMKLTNSLRTICEMVSERITGWNWTGNDGQPLPQPYKAPDVIEALTDEELMYLIAAVQGETPGHRKNA